MTITTAFCISNALGLIACVGWCDCARALGRQCRKNKELIATVIALHSELERIEGGSDG